MEIKPNKLVFPTRKVTRENLDLILQDIREGAPNKHAAESNGISQRHFYYLVKQGVCDIENDIHDSLAAYLVQTLRKIDKEEIKSCKNDIRNNEKGHKGAEWILEHSFWREFSSNAPAMELNERMERLEQGEKSHAE